MPEEEYNCLEEKIRKIDVSNLESKIKSISNIIDKYLNSYYSNWEEYNLNYKEYMCMKLKTISEKMLNVSYIIKEKHDFFDNIDSYLEFYNIIEKINTDNDVMDYFAFQKKNYVIFGTNGSGKTKLLNYIKNNYFKTNSFVIPASRNIEYGKQKNIEIDYKEYRNLSNIFEVEPYEGYTNDILTVMIKDLDYEELRKGTIIYDHVSQINIGQTLNTVIEIFNALSVNRKIKFDDKVCDFKLYDYDEEIEPYSIKYGSDGEKSILQYILFILLCPKNSFVFIDEPETHLNTALLNELFRIIESKRKDLIFIYCTHNIDFIETRPNCKLIYLNKYNGNTWDMKESHTFDEIPIDIIINMIGTKKKILFIESNDKKIDYKFYAILFSDYKVIPVSSCTKVIENCKVINNNKIFNREALGIIDNDYRKNQEIDKLKKYHVYTLKYNEVENLLLAPDILNYMCDEVLHCTNMKEKIKNNIIKKAKQEKQGIIQDYINKIYPRIDTKIHIKTSSIDEIQRQMNIMNLENQANFFTELKEFNEKLDAYIDNNDYENIVKNISDKGFLSCVTTLGVTKERYIELLLSYIDRDDNFKRNIINMHFKELDRGIENESEI